MKVVGVVLALTAVTGACMAAGDAKAGEAVYNKACRSCHGADGTPNATIAKMMKVEMRHLGDPAVQAKSDDEWTSDITKGTGKMKPVKSLNEKQVADVIAFCRTLKK